MDRFQPESRAAEIPLWGIDFTRVWVLGFFPLWVLGVVDYRGSRLVAFEVVRWPTAEEVCRVLGEAFDKLGAPSRLISDTGRQFRSDALEVFLAARGVEQIVVAACSGRWGSTHSPPVTTSPALSCPKRRSSRPSQLLVPPHCHPWALRPPLLLDPAREKAVHPSLKFVAHSYARGVPKVQARVCCAFTTTPWEDRDRRCGTEP